MKAKVGDVGLKVGGWVSTVRVWREIACAVSWEKDRRDTCVYCKRLTSRRGELCITPVCQPYPLVLCLSLSLWCYKCCMFKLGEEFHPVAELDGFHTYLTFIPMPIDIRFTANSHKTCSYFQLPLAVLDRSSLCQRVNLCPHLCVFPFIPLSYCVIQLPATCTSR